MKNKIHHIIAIIVIIISILIGIYYYDVMPAKMASHWNSKGEINGYMPKFWGLFLMPLITIGIYLMFLIIPKIDPLKENIKKFEKYFNWFIALLVLFLFYIYLLSIGANLGYKFNMTQMMMPALGILFIYIGILLEHAKRNWFIGIRTPWTLSNEKVWYKTHILGGKLFKVAGALIFIGILFDQYAMWIVIITALWAGLYPVIYSYFEYKKDCRM